MLTAHGVFVEIDGLGVWIRGASASGKSELALELVSRGHRLVADDAIEFCLDDAGVVVGRSPELIEGFIAVRGLGILNLRRLYGERALSSCAPLELIVALGGAATLTADQHLAGRRATHTVLGRDIAEITLSRRGGRNLAVLVEAAGRDQRLRQAGYDAGQDLIQRQASALSPAARPAGC